MNKTKFNISLILFSILILVCAMFLISIIMFVNDVLYVKKSINIVNSTVAIIFNFVIFSLLTFVLLCFAIFTINQQYFRIFKLIFLISLMLLFILIVGFNPYIMDYIILKARTNNPWLIKPIIWSLVFITTLMILCNSIYSIIYIFKYHKENQKQIKTT